MVGFRKLYRSAFAFCIWEAQENTPGHDIASSAWAFNRFSIGNLFLLGSQHRR